MAILCTPSTSHGKKKERKKRHDVTKNNIICWVFCCCCCWFVLLLAILFLKEHTFPSGNYVYQIYPRACMTTDITLSVEGQEDRSHTKLQALVYNILPSTTAIFSYAIGSRKLSANKQFFVGAQAVASLLQATLIISDICFITDHVAYTS